MAGLSGLSACGLNKDSREWIEKNRVSDIYKVYPTKDPEDLFKVFPDGFDIEQSYIDEKGRAFRIYLEGEPDSKVISGEMVQNPNIKGTKKVADVIYENGHFIFTNKTTDFNWPLGNFLFQNFTISEKFISGLTEKDHGYNSQNGSFYMDYELDDPKLKSLFGLKNTKITNFGISGNGKDYFVRTVSFDFSNDTSFTETIERKVK
ncbi:lipoprotein [Streptococcus criceti]|uniref:Lipoprotein n=1 Tax=Streptococcus criceti HS-6 TaxID=873449 RepID=G5JMU1_STRCG|nr:hypothetical protein [Streptococcus criceti]EHI74048.1 hypothetical protein STRCR_0056 [Streptococcus criceti HS-6]SUN41571.1 lipoprotein [Streptococcus criceti]